MHTGISTIPHAAADSANTSDVLETKSRDDSNDITEHCHDDEREPYLSAVCDKRFTKKQCSKARRKCRTGQLFYSCAQCKKRFRFRTTLYHHMNIHTGKYRCTECDKCCGNNRDLALHSRQYHSGKELFLCTVCSKQFTTSHGLTIHSKIHSEEKLYKCTVCEKAFWKSESLVSHMTVHTSDKPSSSCSQSDKSSSQVHNLQKRESCKRSKREPFQCPYCNKLFKANRFLKQHIRIHTGEKPFSCRHCPYRFMWHHQLKQHLLKSHDGKSLIYDICQKTQPLLLPCFLYYSMKAYVFSECPFSECICVFLQHLNLKECNSTLGWI